jgi:hypothetical protein
MLGWALLAYGLGASALAFCQWNYLNADFVAYATVARRLLAHPADSVTGYWSPLYSWLMAPLLAVGLGDVVAGRLVLLTAGTGYIAALYGLARRLAPADESLRRVFLAGVLFCAVLEAAVWANHLLDPDLLANALLFAYLGLLLDERFARHHWRAVAAGLCAGLAYLAKAYMLPFILAQLPLALLFLARRGVCSSSQPEGSLRASFRWRPWLSSVGWALLGLMLVAGPWIAVLSAHYGRLTFSTAGPANHANVGPSCFRLDPLWNPPLQADFIFDPHFGPDWSPFQSQHHFWHQLYLIYFNTRNGLGHLAGWLLMLAAGGGWLWRLRRRSSKVELGGAMRRVIGFLALTAGVYWSGYAMVNLEARYVVPTIAPLCCLAGLVCLCAALNAGGRLAGIAGKTGRPALCGLLLMLPFSAQDLGRVFDIAFKHSQSSPLAANQSVADDLRRAGLLAQPFAASNWHGGLNIAYAGHALPLYLGRPLAGEPDGRAEELRAARARAYVQFLGASDADAPPPLPGSWQRVLSLARPNHQRVEVYTPAR